jgi:hypothetical protein
LLGLFEEEIMIFSDEDKALMNLAATEIGIAAIPLFEDYCFDYNVADIYDLDFEGDSTFEVEPI